MNNSNKTDIINITIDKLLKGFNVLTEKNKSVHKLTTVEITDKDRQDIKEAIAFRNSVNEERGVTKFAQYFRPSSTMVDEKCFTAEIMFTKVMTQIYNNANIPDFEIQTPPIAEYILDKSKQDYVIKNNKESITFDVKGQFEEELSLNINQKAFSRMKLQSKFSIAGIVQCGKDTYTEAKTITFYFINNEFYEKASTEVFPKRANSTPFRTLPLKMITEYAN